MKFSGLLCFALVAVACGKEQPQRSGAGGPAQVAEVGVITVQPKNVALTRELPGRTSAFRVAEVRARVNGIVQKRLFNEGADVKEGQPLFRIDPEPYRATLESAQAQVARAEATAESAKSLAERYTKLIETNAVSRQEYDDAVAKHKSALAEIAAARAAVKAARINLDYTVVTAPIAGRIGRSEVTEGAYVQQSTATLLAKIQQLDPVYVDLTWSAAELMRVRRSIEAGETASVDGTQKVAVILEDGRTYPEPGKLQFADVSVDQTTGSVALRALVPNPRAELLPGMFVRARIEEGEKANALLVPQRAVTRDQTGRAIVLVVDKAGKVERRLIETERELDDAWLVTKGLAAGDQIIVEGLQKARPGATVKTVPAGMKQAQAAPTAPGSGAPPPQGSGSAAPQGGGSAAPQGSGAPKPNASR
jgi:membrane fusion protein (multidrug efflux system)